MVAVRKKMDADQIKKRLIDLRQDPAYKEIKTDLRRAVRYIENLETCLDSFGSGTEKSFKGK